MLRYNDVVRGEFYVKPQGRTPAIRRGGSLKIEPTENDILREEIQSHRRSESLKIPRSYQNTPERKLSFKRPSLVPEIENGEDIKDCLYQPNRRKDPSPSRDYKLSPSRHSIGIFAQNELNGDINGGPRLDFGTNSLNISRKSSVDFKDISPSEEVFYFKRMPRRSSSLKTELYSTRAAREQNELHVGVRARSKSFKHELLKPVYYNESVKKEILEGNLNSKTKLNSNGLDGDSSITDSLQFRVRSRSRSPTPNRSAGRNSNYRYRCNSAPTNTDIMNYLMNIDARISMMGKRLDWLTFLERSISTGVCNNDMTKEAVRENDPGDRKMSVPKICHEVEGEILNIPENRILQRRRLLHGDGQLSPNTAHGRSCSFRNRPRPKLLNVDVDRPRRSSLPSPSANLLSVSFDDIHGNKENTEPLRRVRSFKTTSKGGVINRGDSFKRSSHSVNSTGSAVVSETGAAMSGLINGQSNSRQRIDSTNSKDSGTAESTSSSIPPPVVYRVAILGDKGVGKTSLTNQFMTSEFVAYENDNDDEDKVRHVTVLLNAEESTLEFEDRPMDNAEISNQNFDAFGVVFSITDRASFQVAVDTLYTIRHELDRTDKPTILIANKIDLVRKRKVAREEGRAVAKQYDCKYAETSAVLNHHVDELLVGFLSQIRLKITPGIKMEPPSFPSHAKGGKQIMAGPKKFLHKLFKKNMGKTSVHECENLFSD